uniref:Gamma-tubulin complex component n=1 Tax=Elaeophora elaphi TaxID=1147741 RepID=A0A158Q8J8_9BILA
MVKNELELHWLSTSRINPTENRVHTSFDLHSYCEAIEDQLFSRALIGAVYQCLLQGIHIPYEDLVEVLEDRCEQSDIEVEGIDECVRFLCSHVANIRKQTGDLTTDADDETRSSDFFRDDVLYRLNDGDGKSCEEEQEDFRFAFDELLSQNFRKIPNFPSYFYFVRNNATNKDLTINLPETRNFNKASSLCEDLEICYIGDEEDVKEEDDSARNSQSSISFESVTASELSDREAFHLSDNAAVPLFLNFSCAIRFSNMDMYTFPIDHLPSCVMQLLKQCSNISKKNFTAMDLIGISFDIYVLSWPIRQCALTQSDSCAISPKTPDALSESFQKFTTYFDFDSPYSTTTSDVINQLPNPENEAVRRLECGIKRLLHMETVFVLSRYDVTLDTLQKVMVFIDEEQREKNDTIRFKVKLLQLVMVMEQAKAVRRLKERIKNFHLLYCKLEAHPESSNLFYCCHVADVDLYEDTLRKQMHTATSITLKSSRRSSGSFTKRIEEQISMTVARKVSSVEVLNIEIPQEKLTKRRNNSVPILKTDRTLSEDYADYSGTAVLQSKRFPTIISERTRYKDLELRDFWIILNVEMQQIQAFFCERYAHHHEKIFELLLQAIQKECHVINQELLLEKMHSTSECDDLLIENETESHKFVPSDLHDLIPDTKLTRSLIHKHAAPRTKQSFRFSYSDEDEVDATPYMPARVFYPPGHFACQIVMYHWFHIHPRLHIEKKGAGCSLVMGYDALRQGIEQFAVRNRRNLYVCCEDNKRNVFYMQLFVSEESFRKRCLHYDTIDIDEMNEKFQNNVLLTVHGIHEPTMIIRSIVDAMQKRLELKVLEELTDILYKNPRTRLTTTDVEFIQRDPAKPFAVHYCTLPNYIYGYLGSLYYYMYQQMLTFTTEARFRDCSSALNRNSPLSHERSCFHSQSGTQPACNNYIPHFFLISKPPTKGIACVETRIVNSSGACIDSLKYARISPSTHSKLYPGGGKFRLSSNERFHELTRCITTSLPLSDSLLSEKAGCVSYLVQYTIWQVGDVGLASLQPIFRLALQQALCDLISEFGLLSIPLVEVVSSTRNILSNTLIVPYVAGEERIRSCSDAAHLDFAAKPLRKTESHIQPPPLEQLPLQAVSRKSLCSSTSDDCKSTCSVNYQFITVAAQWFDHVVSEVKNTEHQFSVKRHTFHCKSDHSVRKIFSVIEDKLSVILKHETIVTCHLEANGSKRFAKQSSTNENVLSFNNDSGRIVAGENEEPSLIMLAYNHKYSEAILKYGADSRSNIIPAAVEEVLHDQKVSSMLFLPQIAPFVPRQHLLYLLSKGEMATLYLYNYSSDAAEQIYQMVANVLSWQNARSRLLREIGLHKMGVTHLSGRITPTGEELVWLNSELLSEYEIPQHGSVHFDKRLVSGAHHIQAEPLMHLYRHTSLAFLPLNLNSNNLFEDQCSQMVFLEKQVSPLHFERALVADSPGRHISGSKMSLLENSSSISQMRTTRSKTFSALLYSSDRAIRKSKKSFEEDEPCCLKIQFMLVESYVQYLTKSGLKLLDITAVNPVIGQAGARYGLHYDMQSTESSPNVWMYKACDSGILFVHITIIEPHFSYEDQRDLYMLKDSIISKAHVHSFTYDFHLRMVATYLIGGQQVLFNYGYNTNEFLSDFLQYYNCRPPYACSCIYEEKMTFPNLPVTNQKVWEYLLDEKHNNWRIVRLKTMEMDMPGQFMIVTEDDTDCFGLAYKEIRAIVHENQVYAAKTLNIKFYVMLVSHEKTDPLVESLDLDAGYKCAAKINGEFKKLGVLNVSCSMGDYRKNAEDTVEQDDANNAWCAPVTYTRRRCRSGDNRSAKKAALPRNYSNGMELNECCSKSNEKAQISKEKTHKLSIQNIAPLRHRRTRPNFRDNVRLSDPTAIVPREQAFYVYYMSRRQKRLQKELEDSVMHYKRKLQMIIEDAVWHCKRNQLWDDMLEKHVTKRETVEMTEQWKLLARHSNDVTSVLRLALSTSLTTTDLDNLLGYVKSESLNIYEPLLDSLHLVIITPEAQQDVFLFTAQNDEPLQMKLLAKERKCNESGSLLMEADHAVREQFNELVRCAASSVWMSLVHVSSSII